MRRTLGVAISGGGHRAALWGLGTLLYLVDKGINERVTTITSVSGGSITNGVVGHRLDYSTANSDDFRTAIRPLVDHIVGDGLFFFGSATNGYLARLFSLMALGVAGLVLVVGVPTVRAVLYLLDRVGLGSADPLAPVTPWPVGLALILGFGLMTWAARSYSGEWNPLITTVGGLGVAAGVALIGWDIVADPAGMDRLPFLVLAGAVTVTFLALALTSFGRRSEHAEAAMDRVHFQGARLSALTSRATTHIMCASELQSGIHAFFTGRFIYSYQYGLSTATDQVRLAKAVQASAALPGAFAPRKIETAGMEFRSPVKDHDGAANGTPMLLMDGGVYDNMADQWFVRLDARRDSWEPEYRQLIPDADDVLVVNASSGWQWKPFGKAANRHLSREAKALGSVISLLYNTVGRRRRAHLRTIWAWDRQRHRQDPTASHTRGAFVEVNDEPQVIAPFELRSRIDEIEPPAGWSSLVRQSRDYPTVLRRIVEPIASEIMWHAYLVTALRAHRWLGIDATPSDLPSYEEFRSSIWE